MQIVNELQNRITGPEDEGATIIRNVGDDLPVDAESHPRSTL